MRQGNLTGLNEYLLLNRDFNPLSGNSTSLDIIVERQMIMIKGLGVSNEKEEEILYILNSVVPAFNEYVAEIK